MAQKRILLTRTQRLAALRAIEPRRLRRPDGSGRPVSVAQWRHVAEVLRQVELTTTADGCSYSYAATLAARMHNGAGVSRATFFRARGLAESLGLLVAVQRWGETVGQQQTNQWRVDWTRVAALCGPIEETGRESANVRPFETLADLPSEGASPRDAKARNPSLHSADIPLGRRFETPPCQLETPPSQLATLPIGSVKSVSNSLGSTVDPRDRERNADPTDADDRRPSTAHSRPTTATRAASLAPTSVDDSEAALSPKAVSRRPVRSVGLTPEAAHLAKSGFRLLSNEHGLRPKCDLDRSLIVKAAVVACDALSPHWFHDALGGVGLARAGREWAYLNATLANNARDLGFDFKTALQRIRVDRAAIDAVCRAAFTRETLCGTEATP